MASEIDQQFLEPHPYPAHIDIDLASKCNLRCSFCHLSYFSPKDSGIQISISEFDEKIVPLLPHLKSITLFSKYEPLTCRNFLPIFNRICEYDIEIYFSSNGTLFTDEILEAIVGNLRYLTLSVNGFTKERYMEIMRFDGFDIVKDNLDKLNRLKEEQGTSYPILRFSMVGMQDTLEDIPAAIDFAHAYNAAEGIQLASLYVYEEGKKNQIPATDIERYNRLTDAALAYAKKKGVKLVLQSGSMSDNADATKSIGHKHCDIPWSRLSIQSNGDVYPCAVAYKPIGNFHDNTLEDIWAGEAMSTYRLGVNDPDNMNEDCRNCIHCRHRTIADVDKSDFSAKKELYGGLTRKRNTL